MSHLTSIAAVARNSVIGGDADMLWHIPEDFAHFKHTTMGHSMIMGRTTFEGMGALPGRRSIVITRNPSYEVQQPEREDTSVVIAHSLPEALSLVAHEDAFVVGGAQIYAAAMPHVDRLIISEVPLDPAGDALFPPIEPAQWSEVSREPRTGFTVVTYERSAA